MERKNETNNPIDAKDKHLAALLGVDVSDYYKLSHSGFRAINGLDGKPMNFYTVISPLNPKPILDRLKPRMNKMNTVYIPAESLKIKDLPEDASV